VTDAPPVAARVFAYASAGLYSGLTATDPNARSLAGMVNGLDSLPRPEVGKTYDATIVGTDPTSDLAVIKAKNASGWTPATLGSSADLVVGQTVVAVGSPLGLSGTVVIIRQYAVRESKVWIQRDGVLEQ